MGKQDLQAEITSEPLMDTRVHTILIFVLLNNLLYTPAYDLEAQYHRCRCH